MLKESSITVFPLCAENLVCISWFTSFMTYYPHFIDEVIVVQRSSTSEKLSSYFRILVKRKAQFKPSLTPKLHALPTTPCSMKWRRVGNVSLLYKCWSWRTQWGEERKKHKNFLRTPKYPFHKMQKSRKEWNDWIGIKPYCDALKRLQRQKRNLTW